MDLKEFNPEKWCERVKRKSKRNHEINKYHHAYNRFRKNMRSLQNYYNGKAKQIEKSIKEARFHLQELSKWQEMCMEPDYYIIPPVVNKFELRTARATS